jgi:hypothetical protein
MVLIEIGVVPLEYCNLPTSSLKISVTIQIFISDSISVSIAVSIQWLPQSDRDTVQG